MINSIVTNLMVTDMGASLDFYHRAIGLEIAFTVNADHETDSSGGIRSDAIFASLHAEGSEMMLQERQNMAEDSTVFSADQQPGGTLSIYFRSDDVDAVIARLGDRAEVVKPLQTTWYGMKEIWLRDPDGWIITVGTPDGPPPST